MCVCVCLVKRCFVSTTRGTLSDGHWPPALATYRLYKVDVVCVRLARGCRLLFVARSTLLNTRIGVAIVFCKLSCILNLCLGITRYRIAVVSLHLPGTHLGPNRHPNHAQWN